MTEITKEKFIRAWDKLPDKLREVLVSPSYGELVRRIGQDHHLDKEKGSGLLGVTAWAILGLLHISDVAKEIEERLMINSALSQSIARELNEKIFSVFKPEINSLFHEAMSNTKVDSIAHPPQMPEISQVTAPAVKAEPRSATPPQTLEPQTEKKTDEPFVLHEAAIGKQQSSSSRVLSVPFKFFSGHFKDASQSVKAKVETPKESSTKVVHYSESRSSLTPFEQPSDVIDLDLFSKENRQEEQQTEDKKRQ